MNKLAIKGYKNVSSVALDIGIVDDSVIYQMKNLFTSANCRYLA